MSPEPRRAGEAGGPWPHGRSPAAAAKVAAFLMSLRSLGVRDLALLSAVERTQREAFLPPGLGELAYVNVALPISCGQTAFTPKEMIQRIAVMQVERRHNILEVGAGSGYQTALLSACMPWNATARLPVALPRACRFLAWRTPRCIMPTAARALPKAHPTTAFSSMRGSARFRR